jgi:4-hydroxybenzoate polyprenyltransferase
MHRTAADPAERATAATASLPAAPLRIGARPVRTSAATFARSLWSNFVFGGYLMPLADAAGIGALGLLLLGSFPWYAAASIFLLTFFIYALNRIVEIDIDGVSNPERTRLLRSQRRIQIALVTLSLAGGIVVQFAAQSWQAVLCAALWTGTGWWYCFGLKNFTRRVVGLKGYVIAFMYGLWPLHVLWFNTPVLPRGALELTTFVILRMLLSTSVSDLKDVEMDRGQGLRTFAVVMPPQRFLFALHALNLISAAPIIAGLLRGSLPPAAAGLLLSVPFGMFFRRAESRDSRSARWFTAAVLDAEGLVWATGILLALWLRR